MAFNCTGCGIELPGTPETAKNCYFCEKTFSAGGGQPPKSPESGQNGSEICITPHESNYTSPYHEARRIINRRHREESYRQMARQDGVKNGKVDSMAAALSHVARGGKNRPAVLVFLGIEEPKVEVTACPHCGDEAHTYNCQEQIVKPKPKPRPKRKRRRYFKCRPDDPEQVMRQLEKYYPGEFERKE